VPRGIRGRGSSSTAGRWVPSQSSAPLPCITSARMR
jgi:hypothetical protein